jgi:hypothetical protein
VSTAYLFRKVANEMVAIEAGSRSEAMTRWEAFARQVKNLTLNKDPSAARLLLAPMPGRIIAIAIRGASP